MSSPDVRAQSARQKSGATASSMCGVSAAAHLAADRWEALLDEAVRLASAGGYDAVQMRVIAKHAGMAVGTLYRFVPSKNYLLAAALTRQFRRVEAGWGWTASAATPAQRLDQLSDYLHDRWQTDPLLTEAMVKAFRVTDRTAADVVNQAAAIIEDLLARTLAGGTPTVVDRRVAAVIADIWLANLTAFIGQRATAAQTRERITEATRRILANLALSSTA